MQGFFHQMFQPRANNDIQAFLPANVAFIAGDAGLDAHLAAARRGECRVLLECPRTVEGIEFGAERYAESLKARSVVADGWFGPELPLHRILLQHNFVFREVRTPVAAHLAAARVAGYRNACFGLTGTEVHPLLFVHPGCANILIATTPLSSFIQSRFAPVADWRRVIGRILGFLSGDDAILPVEFSPSVHPTYAASEPLPEQFELRAFKRNAEWFYREMLFNHHGKLGVFEGYRSVIDVTGRQWLMPKMRGDCMGECAAVGALDAVLHEEAAGREMADGLLKTLFTTSLLLDDNPASQTYGSLFFDENLNSVYGDDNSRAALGAVLAGELLADERYAESVLRLAYSLWRTTGENGLREPSLFQPRSFTGGRTWKYYHGRKFDECRPHYQAWHWAFDLQMYVLSGDRRFRDHAVAALTRAIGQFPDFLWQNGATGDWARLLLPFAMLVEVEDTPEHRAWLDKVCTQFIDHMNAHHVVPELMGKVELGKYPSPRCNADHGTCEAALVQKDGDPACDLLYTMNYAFAGMHEAYMATGDSRYKAACDGMAEFFCRVQAASQAQSYLDGAWLRGFDFELWEFFGNASDSGWGPWCVETGWTNAWIAATLALRRLNRPLLCRKQHDVYRAKAPKIAGFMLEHVFPAVTYRGLRTEVDTAIVPAYAEES